MITKDMFNQKLISFLDLHKNDGILFSADKNTLRFFYHCESCGKRVTLKYKEILQPIYRPTCDIEFQDGEFVFRSDFTLLKNACEWLSETYKIKAVS